MANPIKYSVATQSNSIKAGNFAIGVNKGGYGPTNVTYFYNGRTPNVGGYTVYVSNGGTASPSIFMANNDVNLITLSNQLGGSGITTIAAALNFFNASSTMLCTNNMDYPNIVTNGLVLNLDAAFTPSYPKNGTTWRDLSGNGNNGTLINGPTFNSGNGGSIVFDGTNDYVNCGNILNYTTGNFSFSCWVFINSLTTNAGGQGPILFYKGSYRNNGYYNQIGQDGSVYFITNTNPEVASSTAAGTIVAGNTYNITFTRNGASVRIYVNGVDLTSTTGVHTTIPSSTANFNIASYNQGQIVANIRMYNFLNYNRELTVQEILQNYYAGLQRLIPTDGLVLSLDAQNTNRRISNPTIANDMSGNNYNGNMMNGTALSIDGGTSFSFDGTNDYIETSNFSTIITNSFSIGVWIKFNNANSPTYQKIIHTQIAPLTQLTNEVNLDNYNGGSGNAKYHFYTRAILGNSTNDIMTSTVTITDNTWVYVVGVYDNTTKTKYLYLNGVINVSASTSVQITWPNNVTWIGRRLNSSEPFNGKISTTQIYSRALTATEISTIYTATKSRYDL